MKGITDFLEEVEVVFIDDAIVAKTIEYRKSLKIKVPDAIIAATARVKNLSLVTFDKPLIKKIKDIKTIDPI